MPEKVIVRQKRDFTTEFRDLSKLHKVSRHCPIQKIIENGVGVLSELAGGR